MPKNSPKNKVPEVRLASARYEATAKWVEKSLRRHDIASSFWEDAGESAIYEENLEKAAAYFKSAARAANLSHNLLAGISLSMRAENILSALRNTHVDRLTLALSLLKDTRVFGNGAYSRFEHTKMLKQISSGFEETSEHDASIESGYALRSNDEAIGENKNNIRLAEGVSVIRAESLSEAPDLEKVARYADEMINILMVSAAEHSVNGYYDIADSLYVLASCIGKGDFSDDVLDSDAIYAPEESAKIVLELNYGKNAKEMKDILAKVGSDERYFAIVDRHILDKEDAAGALLLEVKREYHEIVPSELTVIMASQMLVHAAELAEEKLKDSERALNIQKKIIKIRIIAADIDLVEGQPTSARKNIRGALTVASQHLGKSGIPELLEAKLKELKKSMGQSGREW